VSVIQFSKLTGWTLTYWMAWGLLPLIACATGTLYLPCWKLDRWLFHGGSKVYQSFERSQHGYRQSSPCQWSISCGSIKGMGRGMLTYSLRDQAGIYFDMESNEISTVRLCDATHSLFSRDSHRLIMPPVFVMNVVRSVFDVQAYLVS
jgi:hypothetical protein